MGLLAGRLEEAGLLVQHGYPLFAVSYHAAQLGQMLVGSKERGVAINVGCGRSCVFQPPYNPGTFSSLASLSMVVRGSSFEYLGVDAAERTRADILAGAANLEPIASASVHCYHSIHSFEHFFESEIPAVLREAMRVSGRLYFRISPQRAPMAAHPPLRVCPQPKMGPYL